MAAPFFPSPGHSRGKPARRGRDRLERPCTLPTLCIVQELPQFSNRIHFFLLRRTGIPTERKYTPQMACWSRAAGIVDVVGSVLSQGCPAPLPLPVYSRRPHAPLARFLPASGVPLPASPAPLGRPRAFSGGGRP